MKDSLSDTETIFFLPNKLSHPGRNHPADVRLNFGQVEDALHIDVKDGKAIIRHYGNMVLSFSMTPLEDGDTVEITAHVDPTLQIGYRPPVPKPETYLSPEQLNQTELVRSALVAKFEHLGAKAEDFDITAHTIVDEKYRPVVDENGNTTKQVTLVYTAENGLDLAGSDTDHDPVRSWRSIVDPENDEKFVIEVDGIKYDTRSGMDQSVASEIGKIWSRVKKFEYNAECFWLTGFRVPKQDMYSAPLGYLKESGYYEECMETYDYKSVKFRPVAVIAKTTVPK